MYDHDSIGRSVRRYLAEMLGPPWKVALERDEVRDDARPAGVVEVGEVRLRSGRTSIPQGNVERFAPVTVTLYPAMHNDAGVLLHPRVAGRAARQLASRVNDLITFGAEWYHPVTRRPLAGPERIPLYDYDGIDIESDDPAERAGPEYPHDWLWAEDYSAGAIQDPLDARRWTVILELRVSWEQPGRVGPAAPTVGSMPGRFHGEVRPELSP